ncbi:substrate-binding domain-containing protein [Bacterioplanoides sp. SCSIO 12839]|uniref:substrate-binding domain-containing protein n=1 Tax=Bacterioplanoides sp. SCSIO 12839 TaxID=2829569 RepID=UPI0021083CD3|nr:phosphate ABC transporter substrate-binding/OmpA family protein [Bacterioplanoides sp. SCSIO 12839]UTW47097.1 phosphate ABC transporter substrate-binding/OmpA family protein [Bacterioplanoides sp. SCSIO 12839]
MKLLSSLLLVCLTLVSSFSNALERFSDLPYDGTTTLFTIHGSNTIGAALAPNLVKEYLVQKGAEQIETLETGVENEKIIRGVVRNSRTIVEVVIEAHGSGTGFKGLDSQQADIAAASRPAKDKEANLLKHKADMRAPESEHIVGIDGLAIIVHPQNPIHTLSVDQIAGIFAGDYQNWSELGGNPGQINVYARDDKSGTWDSFKGMVLGKQSSLIETAERFESNDELSDRVSADAQGIGFVGLASVRQSKLVAVSDGTAKALLPNKLTVATEDYALARRLYMYTAGVSANAYVNEFLNFVLENSGQKIVADTGFISQELMAVMPETYAELPQDFRDITANAERLTINFRFKEGSAKLDNKALKDVERLVQYLKTNNTNEIVLIGFGDKKKTEERARLLSKLRAMAVRRELVRNGIYPKESVGYGEYLPVASINRSEGRMKNRRVEVWLRDGAAIATAE